MLIAQLTDCHIVAPGELVADRVDTAAALRRAIEVVNALDPLPDLVLATGDLVDDGRPEQYDHLLSLLSALRPPLVVAPGNHDDRTELRRRFDHLPAGRPDEPLDQVVADPVPGAPLRLVGLDTTIPGRNDGRFTARQAEWLDSVLTADPERPTLVFQHHPPFASGIAWMDAACGFDGVEREAAVIGRHPQVEAIVCGHLHRAMHRRFAGTVASSWPSTGAQMALDLRPGPPRFTTEPAAVALHRWDPATGLVSHLIPTVDVERWTPAWAVGVPPPPAPPAPL